MGLKYSRRHIFFLVHQNNEGFSHIFRQSTMGGCPSPLGQTNPYRPRKSRVNPMWPQCGSTISNPQPLGVLGQLSYPFGFRHFPISAISYSIDSISPSSALHFNRMNSIYSFTHITHQQYCESVTMMEESDICGKLGSLSWTILLPFYNLI